MRDKLEDRLAEAVRRATPEKLDDILKECEGRSMTDFTIERENRKKKNKWAAFASAAAAVLVLAAVSVFGYQNMFRVDSVIGIDVNPSIELKTSRSEKILSATPLNSDAEKILGDMNLKNVELEVAMNAIIGSMLKNGYISDIKNSVLITVENPDSEKSAALQKKLAEEVNMLLEQNSLEGAVVSQVLPEDKELRDLADQYGISLGKASFIQDLIRQDATLKFEDMAGLTINDLNLLAESKKVPMSGAVSTGTASGKAYLGEEKAYQAALKHAGISAGKVTSYQSELDFEDGKVVYEVEFLSGGVEYEYDVDASTGEVLKYSQESKASAPAEKTQGADVSESKAKSIALKHAGVKESAAAFTKVKLDTDDGRLVYEIEFYADGVEYDYDIDAKSGDIVKYSSERRETSKPAAGSGSSGGQISESAAKAAALKHAGVKESAAAFTKVKLDMDDGRLVYEIEFYADGVEYDYDIDAKDGGVVKQSKETRDSDEEAPAQPPAKQISAETAKTAALKHAGVKAAEAVFEKVELEEDDGKYCYDLEFKAGGIEYDYEVDASTGNVISAQSETEDHD